MQLTDSITTQPFFKMTVIFYFSTLWNTKCTNIPLPIRARLFHHPICLQHSIQVWNIIFRQMQCLNFGQFSIFRLRWNQKSQSGKRRINAKKYWSWTSAIWLYRKCSHCSGGINFFTCEFDSVLWHSLEIWNRSYFPHYSSPRRWNLDYPFL